MLLWLVCVAVFETYALTHVPRSSRMWWWSIRILIDCSEKQKNNSTIYSSFYLVIIGENLTIYLLPMFSWSIISRSSVNNTDMQSMPTMFYSNVRLFTHLKYLFFRSPSFGDTLSRSLWWKEERERERQRQQGRWEQKRRHGQIVTLFSFSVQPTLRHCVGFFYFSTLRSLPLPMYNAERGSMQSVSVALTLLCAWRNDRVICPFYTRSHIEIHRRTSHNLLPFSPCIYWIDGLQDLKKIGGNRSIRLLFPFSLKK